MVERAAGAKDLIAYTTLRGAAMCVHGRQLTLCGVCAEEAEKRYTEAMASVPKRLDKEPESLLEQFAKDPAVQKFLEPGVPERRSYRLKEDLLPAGEVVPPVRIWRAPEPSAETPARYKRALEDVGTALFLAGTLLRSEQFRTPVGSRTWDTLGPLCERISAVGDALRAEIGRVSEGGGVE